MIMWLAVSYSPTTEIIKIIKNKGGKHELSSHIDSENIMISPQNYELFLNSEHLS